MTTLAILVAVVMVVNTVRGELSQKPCNNPSPPNCLLDPCFLLSTCKNYPQATCRDYMCGDQCLTEFWYNGQEVTSLCEDAGSSAAKEPSANGVSQLGFNTGALGGNTIQGASGTTGINSNAIETGSSPMFDALLANAGSLGLLQDAGGIDLSQPSGTSSPGTSTNTIGAGSTSAGAASSIFDALLGNSQASGASQDSSCPNGVLKMTCTIAPCDITTCPGLSAATCKNNPCGGCKAEFWIGQTDVTSLCKRQQQQQQSQVASSSGPQISKSFTGRALGALSNLAAAAAASSSSSSSSLKLGAGTHPMLGQSLGVLGASGKQPDCPLNKRAICNQSVCRVASCSGIPGATCRVSNCGGCFAKFSFKGQDVTSRCRLRQRQQSSRSGSLRRGQRRRLPPWYYFMFGDMMW